MLLIHPSAPSSCSRRLPISSAQICHGIAELVADGFGLDAAMMMSPTRGAQRTAYARQVAMYLAHVGFALSFEAIGRAFDRDRTTVSHACRVVENSRDDEKLERRLASLETMCAAFGERLDGTPDVGV
jgi:chromosomal replication initiation ATPase DnaA